jgi:hypothetical protein
MHHITEGTVSLLIRNTEGYSQITEKKNSIEIIISYQWGVHHYLSYFAVE